MTADKWTSGAAYDAYMGRWSRMVARRFVEWLDLRPLADWLDVGCGTGALTSAICELAEPALVVGCDPAEPFIAHAWDHATDSRASFTVAGLETLPRREDGFDAIVSGLVLNFLSHPEQGLAKMRERLCPKGVIAAYVWDYATGFEFLQHFWSEAITLDPRAASLDESLRFSEWQPARLASLFESAGLGQIETTELEIPTHFTSFDDFWAPFEAGTGPAPGYVATLEPARRDTLRDRLKRRLSSETDGSLRLHARAWAVRGNARN
jgi:SAM-dependent methyltransferase